MEEFSKLLIALAAIIGALAWPFVLLSAIFVFRIEIKDAIRKITNVFDKIKKASVPGISFELEKIADSEVKRGEDSDGRVTPQQIQVAARIESEKGDVGSSALLAEMDKLCLEYDAIRRVMKSGRDRTQAMTKVLVKMRSLSPSIIDYIDAYKSSGSPGSRLAAIAMMQMVPEKADLYWLEDRFRFENPFLFYHSALAMQNAANVVKTEEEREDLRRHAENALSIIKDFGPSADKNTTAVLESLVSSV